jgi:glycosyltransferase involved in cell wall biosynthesis
MDRAKQLLIAAQGQSDEGCDVHVALLDAWTPCVGKFLAAGIPVTVLDRRWPIDPIAYYRLWRLMRQLRPDVVHTWDGPSGRYGAATASGAGARNIIIGQYQMDPWKSARQWFVERRLAQSTQRLVTDSVYVRDWCVHHGLPAEKFVVVTPGVPPARASDVSREELLRELQLPTEASLIGVVGRLVAEKRVKDLIWAADLLRVLHDNLRLLVIGDGPLRTQLEQYARLASDLEHIRFLGERHDVWRIMPHLDVLWDASEPRGHSMVILEAMAAGVPVIASDTPLNREFVVEGETGYLIPLLERSGRADRARHTDRIFTDPDLAKRIGEKARQRVADQFCSERMVPQYAELYPAAML